MIMSRPQPAWYIKMIYILFLCTADSRSKRTGLTLVKIWQIIKIPPTRDTDQIWNTLRQKIIVNLPGLKAAVSFSCIAQSASAQLHTCLRENPFLLKFVAYCAWKDCFQWGQCLVPNQLENIKSMLIPYIRDVLSIQNRASVSEMWHIVNMFPIRELEQIWNTLRQKWFTIILSSRMQSHIHSDH